MALTKSSAPSSTSPMSNIFATKIISCIKYFWTRYKYLLEPYVIFKFIDIELELWSLGRGMSETKRDQISSIWNDIRISKTASQFGILKPREIKTYSQFLIISDDVVREARSEFCCLLTLGNTPTFLESSRTDFDRFILIVGVFEKFSANCSWRWVTTSKVVNKHRAN